MERGQESKEKDGDRAAAICLLLLGARAACPRTGRDRMGGRPETCRVRNGEGREPSRRRHPVLSQHPQHS